MGIGGGAVAMGIGRMVGMVDGAGVGRWGWRDRKRHVWDGACRWHNGSWRQGQAGDGGRLSQLHERDTGRRAAVWVT